MSDRKVVITGMGVVSPLGCTLSAFWERIKNGESGIRRLQGIDPEGYTSKVAGEVVEFDAEKFIPKKSLRRMDPFSQYGLGASHLGHV